MSTKRQLLCDFTVRECGHRFQAWTEESDDGTWDLHFHCEGSCCERLAARVTDGLFPGQRTVRVD